MISYDVAKEKGGRYYVYNSRNPMIPISGTFKKDKKDALKLAANYSGVPYKEFLKMRKSKDII